MVEGYWKGDELQGEFIMINKKGNVFIGCKKGGVLKGTYLKKSKLQQMKNLDDLDYENGAQQDGIGVEYDNEEQVSTYFTMDTCANGTLKRIDKADTRGKKLQQIVVNSQI